MSQYSKKKICCYFYYLATLPKYGYKEKKNTKEKKQIAYAVSNLNTLGLLYIPTVLQTCDALKLGFPRKSFLIIEIDLEIRTEVLDKRFYKY